MKNFMTTLILFIIYISLKQDGVKTVFDEEKDKDIYMTYCVEIENLDTKNYNDYFSNINVIAIIPSINPIYEKKIQIIYFDDDIDKLKKYYIKKLKEKGYYVEANKYLIMPIRIRQVIVYSSINKIYENINFDDKNYNIFESDGYVKITN